MAEIAAAGGYRYKDGSHYVGSWNSNGQPHGEGHILFPDNIRYSGYFEDGKFSGLGILAFPDGARYEGEFHNGWFHGYGTFWRADNMRFEGEFRGGQISGLGRMTFNDGSNGFPRHEGFFKDKRVEEQKKCPETVDRVQKISFMARERYFSDLFDD